MNYDQSLAFEINELGAEIVAETIKIETRKVEKIQRRRGQWREYKRRESVYYSDAAIAESVLSCLLMCGERDR